MAKNLELSVHIQDSIIFLSIVSTPFLKLVRNYVRPDLLSVDIAYWVLKACYAYYDLTKEAPGDHLCDVLDDQIKGVAQSKRDLIYHFVDRVSQMKPPNTDYVISKLNAFVKTREFELAAVEFVNLVDKQQFPEAELLMHNTLKRGIEQVNLGCDYLHDFSFLNRPPENAPLLRLGIKHFDPLRVFHRSELCCILGGYKGKKSWMGIHFGKMALLQGLDVLHISHENSLEETEARYDRAIGALANEDFLHKPVTIQYIDKKTGKLRSMREQRPCILDNGARKNARILMKKYGGRLIIKKYPPYTCDIGEIDRYLDYLERFEHFVPDLFINDFPDIMKPRDAHMATRDQLNELYLHHKRWVDERRMLGLVFSQSTREAIRAKRLTMKHFAEDIRKLSNVDTALGLCQTDIQAEANLATLYVVAARKGKMDVGCGIVQNLDIGQVASDSFEMKLGVKVGDEESDSNKDS